MTTRSEAPTRKSARRFPWLRILALLLLLAILWVVHPPLLARFLRFSLAQAADRAGLTVEVGEIQSNLAHPIVLNNVKVRAKDPAALRTAANIDHVQALLNWPWRAFFGPKRLVRSVTVEGLRGVFDFPSSALPAKPSGDAKADQDRQREESILQFLPEAAELRGGNMEFIFGRQSYYLEDVSADFSEEHLGRFKAGGAEIHVGDFHESLGSLEAQTAWKDGALYLAELDVREGIKIENLGLQLSTPDGISLSLEGAVFGGSVRTDVSFETQNGAVAIDAALWAANVQAAPLAELLGFHGQTEGVLREARLTFRGLPSQPLDGEVALRLAANGFRWNQRGWDSLTIGANMTHRHLAVSEFSLKQKDNSLTANGEATASENWQDWPKAPFLLNVNGSVNDLAALAGLFGPPFQEMSGRMSLSSSVSGQVGKLDGFLIMEASGMKFRNHPVESGRLDVTFAGNEAQVNQCELWSGNDYARGKGSLQLSRPYTYSGDIQGRASDIAGYLSLFTETPSPVYAGTADLRWQGDGTISSHSGAFNIALDKFVSKHTPSGLTGRFAGTYSPQNIYFSGFELQKGPLLFSTQATLASSGIKLTNALLRSGKSELAGGEFYVPIDPFALIAGRPLGEAVDLDKPVYGSITTRTFVGIRDLLRLGGNDQPAEGSINVDVKASGSLAKLALDAKVEGKGLGMKFEDGQNLDSHLEATVHTAEGQADLAGTLETRGLSPITWKAQGPFGFFKSADSSLHIARADSPISGQLDIPKAELEVFRPLTPGFRRLAGIVTGSVTAKGTVSSPIFEGSLALANGSYEPFPHFPVLTGLAGTMRLDSTAASVENFTGTIGGGPFELRGGVSFTDFTNWHYDLSLTGTKVLFFRDPGLKLRADVNLAGSGNATAGALKGTLSLVDSRVEKRLEVTPLLTRTAATTFHPLPAFDRWIPWPLQKWTADIDVTSAEPVQLVDNVATGEMNVALRVGGTLGHPVPVGRIDLKNARAFLPFTALSVPEGRLDFIENSPWVPQLDVRGGAQALDYAVQLYAFGPLNERRLILRSDPPLPQDSLVSLLTTGIVPSVYARSGLSDITLSRSKPLLNQSFGKQLDTQSASPDSLLGRPQPEAPRGRVQLWQGLSLLREGDTFTNSAVTYSLRFQ